MPALAAFAAGAPGRASGLSRRGPLTRPRAWRPRARGACRARVVVASAAPGVPRAFFCDVDGTLLDSGNAIVPANVSAIARLPYPTLKFIPATGKSRRGALASFGGLEALLRARYPRGVPGVYLQGLVVYGEDGRLLHEETLDAGVAMRAVRVARELGVTLVAYAHDGDRILCERVDEQARKLPEYHEPLPEEVGAWESVVGSVSIHKMIFMAEEGRILEIRPRVEEEMARDAEITRATEGMLEVLPRGASKGKGVAKLQKALGVRPEETLAIGDGENDVEMLRLCGISVAMGNAVPPAVEAAVYSTSSNDEGGVAAALERFVFQTADV